MHESRVMWRRSCFRGDMWCMKHIDPTISAINIIFIDNNILLLFYLYLFYLRPAGCSADTARRKLSLIMRRYGTLYRVWSVFKLKRFGSVVSWLCAKGITATLDTAAAISSGQRWGEGALIKEKRTRRIHCNTVY